MQQKRKLQSNNKGLPPKQSNNNKVLQEALGKHPEGVWRALKFSRYQLIFLKQEVFSICEVSHMDSVR